MSAQPSDLLISRIRALCHEAINVGETSALVVASLELCEAHENLRHATKRLLVNIGDKAAKG
jgi:hypothetical protein